jgi:hypothetical protein
MNAPHPITPKTRVAELLDAYPELLEVLIATAPPFARLKNPVLRRTIARVTSLERAAEVAGIPVRDLVLRLREAAGLAPAADDLPADGGDDGDSNGPAPWVDPARVRWTVDADALLEAGQHPIAEVQSRAADLESDDLGLIRSSFRPAPLIEMLEVKGFRTAVVRSGESFATFIGRQPR